jgi:hypothetical protein
VLFEVTELVIALLEEGPDTSEAVQAGSGSGSEP